jgi:hypothetical protein
MLDIARTIEWLRLRRPITWVCVTVGLAFSGAAALFLQSQFIAGFNKTYELSTALVDDWRCHRRKASIKLSDDLFTMLVSRLQGDTNGAQTAKILIALGGQDGLQLVQICQSLQIDVGNEFVVEQINAIEKGEIYFERMGR